MNRWVTLLVSPLLLTCLATAAVAQEQPVTVPRAAAPPLDRGQMPIIGTRQFPANARRGTLEVKAPPEVTINGIDERLSPGHRIRSPNNHLVMSAQLVGRSVQVNYVRNAQGQIHEVWILNALEQREEREGGGTIRNYSSGTAQESARRDDGKTPFDQLPKFKN